jgi:hypothetical protein
MLVLALCAAPAAASDRPSPLASAYLDCLYDGRSLQSQLKDARLKVRLQVAKEYRTKCKSLRRSAGKAGSWPDYELRLIDEAYDEFVRDAKNF